MNDFEFESAARAAFSPVASDHVSAKIDRRLAAHRQNRRVRRRIVLSLATVGLACIVFVAAPAVRAEAALTRLENALNGVTNLTMRSFTVDASGNRYPAGTMTYDRGRWRMSRSGGATLSYYLNGKLYNFEPNIRAFTVEDRPNGPFGHNPSSFKVSDMISGGMGNSFALQSSTESTRLNGRPVKRISIDNRFLPERYVFYADPETDLPVRMEVEARELQEWRQVSETNFDYSPTSRSAEFAPELKQYPVLQEADADDRFVREMTRESLGGFSTGKGRLIVRKFDVAEDGTVYVVYQSGDRSPNSWSGNAFSLKSDDGMTYARPQIFTLGRELPMPAEGRLEIEAFIPLEPRLPWHPHDYTLRAMRFSNGKLAREIEVGINYADGHTEYHWQPNASSRHDVDAKWVEVLHMKVGQPTCDKMPAYAERLAHGDFGSEAMSAITEARVRAKYYFDTRQWSDAIRWYEAELTAIHEFARQGYGSYGEDEPRTKLDQARRELATPGR